MTRLFGTNGIRGVVNQEIDGAFALEIGLAWGSYLRETRNRLKVALGTDTRISNCLLKHAVTSGFLTTGCDIIDNGILPTPTLQYAVKNHHYDSGVMITASHNPPQFNGIKGIAPDGTEFPKQTEEIIEKYYFSKNYTTVTWDHVGQFSHSNVAINEHISGILKRVQTEKIRKQKHHVVLDCGNGAGCSIAPELLHQLNCTTTLINCTPDGLFSGRPSEPLEKNLSTILSVMTSEKASFGVALDGDADRAIFIDNTGKYLMGDKSLSIIGRFYAQHHHQKLFITPVTTSTVFEEVIIHDNGNVEYTKVGSPIVARDMIKKQAVFGGEENGGLIFPELQYCRDALMTIAKMLEILTIEEQPLSELVKTLPKYEMIKSKILCPNNKKNSVMQRLLRNVQHTQEINKINTTDGIKIFIDEGWVLLRPSGTEPIFRIYAEAKTIKDAEKMVAHYNEIIQQLIDKK
ncbi:MAG: phosphoglucosamine mutase [Candidatus Thermoplasmatota archaeon]|nr:phosphoglucosamine mutase [Candidatus Thermoplasmatota archaeon]MBU1940373.1 phosphoglucosamine mutase [Candidatus Thermoplasmatota archaeon]